MGGVLTGSREACVACRPNFKPLACLVAEISAAKSIPIVTVSQGPTIGFRCEPAVGGILAILCSYLTSRSMVLCYQKEKSSFKSLPGGYGQGALLGGLFFIIRFNRACLRPLIPKQFTKNKAIQAKFIDDCTKVASVNLKNSLIPDPQRRPYSLNYHERSDMVLCPEDVLQKELDRFQDFVNQAKFLVNQKKNKILIFNPSRKFTFPPEFTIGNKTILQVEPVLRILGVQIQQNLKWGS